MVANSFDFKWPTWALLCFPSIDSWHISSASRRAVHLRGPVAVSFISCLGNNILSLSSYSYSILIAGYMLASSYFQNGQCWLAGKLRQVDNLRIGVLKMSSEFVVMETMGGSY